MADGRARLARLKEEKPAKRTPLSAGDIERLLRACVPKVTKNAQELGFISDFSFLPAPVNRRL